METIEIKFREKDLVVKFNYQPEEKPERGPEARYAGCGEKAEIDYIFYKEIDVTKWLLDELQEIEGLVLDRIHETEESNY